MNNTFTALVATAFIGLSVSAQVSGNINYLQQVHLPENNIDAYIRSKDITITVSGVANITADSYVAIFNITQVGENLEEVGTLAQNRIDAIQKQLEGKPDLVFFTDLVSFVPVYEFEVEKKLFSKKYNEIPKGFELKQNLHIRYKNPELLQSIMMACAAAEVYDLIRVDYFSSQLEQVKKDLAAKGKLVLKEKLKLYQELMGSDFATNKKQLADAYKVMYPLEMYKNYQAYSASALNLRKTSSMGSQVEKSTTLYYQPILNKEFDFVVNPEIVEPVIQVLYELTFVVVIPEDKPAEKRTKEYVLVTPGGELKTLTLE